MDCSLPGFSVHGLFQARVLEWVAISFCKGSSWPRDWNQVCIVGRRFTLWVTRETIKGYEVLLSHVFHNFVPNSGFFIWVECRASCISVNYFLCWFTMIKAYLVLSCFTLLSFIDFIALFTEWGLWQPCIEQVHWCHFSKSICSLSISASHYGNSYNNSNFFITIVCYGYPWPVICDVTIIHFLAFFSNKVF